MRNVSSASACRPQRNWASISCPARRSSRGWSGTIAASCGSNSPCRPTRRPASLRSRITASRSASSAVRTSFIHGVSSVANGTPRHIASAFSKRPSASTGSVAARALAVSCAERVQVDRKRISGQHIAAGLPRDFHALFRDHLPKPGYIAGKRVSGTVRQFIGPDPVDQLVGRHRAVHIDQQRDQNTALAGGPDVECLPVGTGLDIAEQPELHCHLYSMAGFEPSEQRIS